jgi:hypothetical protein
MTFPNTYPAKPPDVRFVNRIHHCNINSQGKVCHSILNRNWNPAQSARIVIDCIYGLLLTPELHDPLDSSIAEEYHTDKAVFEQTARDVVKSCASEPKEDMERRLARESPDDESTPALYICPLTKDVMVDPVLLVSAGLTFDRVAITALIRSGGSHPVTMKPLDETAEKLVPNASIADAIKKWQASESVAGKKWWD